MRWSRLDDDARARAEKNEAIWERLSPVPSLDPTQAFVWSMYWDLRHEAGDHGVRLPDDPVLAHVIRAMDHAYADEVAKSRKQESESMSGSVQSGRGSRVR